MIQCGDCLQLIEQLEDKSIRACITSPPYAEQRKLYQGIKEEDYPAWTGNWMDKLKSKLAPDGSVLIVIRPHLRKGELSDYVLKTRLEVRKRGWIECEELIWYKPDAPPLGSILRPRRAWESILWFSLCRNPFVNLKACGNAKSERIGAFAGSDRFGLGGDSPIHQGQKKTFRQGTSRCSDVFTAHIGSLEKGIKHPAMYPTQLTDQLVQTFTDQGDTILDPFVGSGQTLLSAEKFSRSWIGFDVSQEYVDMATKRLKSATSTLQNLTTPVE